MKRDELIEVDAAMPALLQARRAAIDTRAPVEFLRGSLPGAINLPLMDDSERHRVGIAYKREGPDVALALGHELVSGRRKQARLSAWQHYLSSHPEALVFCFRGGQRSSIVQQWLRESGVQCLRLRGGYKAARQWCLEQLQAFEERPLCVIAGPTGADKTGVVNALDGIDLEGLAAHRGSAFGRLPRCQPSQINFEHVLLAAHWQRRHRTKPLVIEDEGRAIGSLSVPEGHYAALRSAPIAVLEVPFEQRVENIRRVYCEELLADYQCRYGQAWGRACWEAHLLGALDRIRRRLGGARHAHLRGGMQSAMREVSNDSHFSWIAPLLRDYYDPMYDHQMRKREDPVIFRGDTQALLGWYDGLA